MTTVTTLPIDRLLTAEEFYALDNDAPCELVRGRVTEFHRRSICAKREDVRLWNSGSHPSSPPDSFNIPPQ